MIMPPRIARLPRDSRGYPIPWNVLRGVDDAPIFTVNDSEKHWKALRGNLCPICGERLGRWKWFTGGPCSAFDPNGWFLDLPGHHECEQFALATCPYLALLRYLRRIDVADPSKLPDGVITLDPTMIPERPDLFVTVAGDKIEVELNGPALPYVRPLRPVLAYEYWRHGEQLTVAEALPLLREVMGEKWTPPPVRL